MSTRVGIEVSIAIADAVKMVNADVVAAYPITPQTHIVEHLAELVANGELDAEYIPVESEHSAMSACVGSAAVGARTFTATAPTGSNHGPIIQSPDRRYFQYADGTPFLGQGFHKL